MFGILFVELFFFEYNKKIEKYFVKWLYKKKMKKINGFKF